MGGIIPTDEVSSWCKLPASELGCAGQNVDTSFPEELRSHRNMKKILLATVLVAATAVAQTASAPAPAQAPQQTQAQPQGQAAPQQKKEIKDPAEYNAYMGASQQTDPAAMISGLEAFATQYPNSVMKEDALELLMGAYQKSGNSAKMVETAQKVVAANPCNIRALALLSFTKRALAESGQNTPQNLAEGSQAGEKGLACLLTVTKPDGTPEADFQKLKLQTGVIFNGAVGINALQNKDNAKAQQYLRASAEGDPANLRDVYPLALAYLTATPADNLNGLFFIARAANLATGSPAAQIEGYGKKQYTKYHGSDQGWTDVMAAAKANNTPPAGFAITKYEPPTPAQQAKELVKTKAPKDMAFAEWELVLSAGDPEDKAKVWDAIKGKPLQLGQTLVLKSSATKLEIAASSDDIDAKRADIVLEMGGPMPLKMIPKEGSLLDFEGTPVSYEPTPFVMQMDKGALLTKAAPKTAPAKKPPVHKKPAAH